MEKWARIKYQPCLPLGDNNSRITGSKKHIELSREAACEGTVLLKNEREILPLKKGTKVAIFGKAQIDYVKGGGGSGDVHCQYVRNIYEGLKLKKDIEIFDALSLFYVDYVTKEAKTDSGVETLKEAGVTDVNLLAAYAKGELCGIIPEAEIPDELVKKASEFTDTAIITINRYSGEGWDRKGDGTDPYFELSKNEKKMVEAVCGNFSNIIVLLNTGSMIDASWFAANDKIGAAVMVWQGGMEGGLAVADILTGEVTPSGKLVDTCAASISDYPSTEGFHESVDYVKYCDDIFVGYRYFETIPGMKERVIYPFGYGLSYTKFEISGILATAVADKIVVSATVKNIGEYNGKEVVQVYYGAPEGKLTKPLKELCAFAKTKLLQPGESETLIMSFDIKDMASYDDTGAVEKSAYVMEAGEYKLFVGNSVADAKEIEFKYELSELRILSKLTEYCKPARLGKRLTATGEYVSVPDEEYIPKTFECKYICEEKIPGKDDTKWKLKDVYEGKVSVDEFLTQLTDRELFGLLTGHDNTGVANTEGMGDLPAYGVPNVMTTDGPAGVRILPEVGVKTTAFPVATMLACSWNTELLERVGAAGALECKENNIFMWLTPALNIHRSPLCGRNFEYYSEDPFVSGKMAAAMVKGIQSQGVVATPKHFACNNKETNRIKSDSILSERALREIYLKGFEICVKESEPKLIMTSYNIINGVYSSESGELIEGILRGEWGYKGLITTDWGNSAERKSEITAGNDIRMPSRVNYSQENFAEVMPLENTRNEMAVCAKRLLELILWFE